MAIALPETFSVGKGFMFKNAGSAGGMRVEDRVGIQAPVETVWDLVHDLPGWSAWNPLYTEASGLVRIGQMLTMTLELPGQPARTLYPIVMEWVPNEQLHWRQIEMRGWATRVHYIEIEKLTETSCIVSNGELVGGMLGPLTARSTKGALRRGFRAMNEALKAAAETAWESRSPAPTSEA
jgi:hypothetical protein